MKKFLNISVIAALAILPLAANADYAEVTIGDADATKVATTGYVKGAYNALNTSKQDKLSNDDLAAIAGVSGLTTRVGDLETAVEGKAAAADVTALTTRVTTAEGDIDALETAVGNSTSGLVKDVADLKTTVGDSTSGLVKDVADNTTDISALETTVGDSTSGLVKDVADLKTASGDYATKTGVAATVNAATGSVDNVSLTVNGTSAGSVSSTFTGDNVNIPTSATVPTLTTWGNDNSNSTATVTLTTTATQVSGTINSTFTGGAITGGTATGSIENIDVSVGGYTAGN